MTDPEIERELTRHLYRPLWLRVLVWVLLPFVWTLQALRSPRTWLIVCVLTVAIGLLTALQLRRQLTALILLQATALEELECSCPETGDYIDPSDVRPETLPLPLPTSETL